MKICIAIIIVRNRVLNADVIGVIMVVVVVYIGAYEVGYNCNCK